jgi:uncharacterized delta-60 repeat protein
MIKLYLIRTIILAGSLLLQLSTLCFHSRGAPGDVDLSFDPGLGADSGSVNGVAVQSDGKVLLSGFFTTVRGLARTNVARLNADGSGDPTFNPGPGLTNLNFLNIALQPDGKPLICAISGTGPSGEWSGSASRLNSNGTLDSSFIAARGSYPYGPSYSCVAVQADGKVLLGGGFEDVYENNENGQAYFLRYLLVRLNTNGTSDTSFAPALGEFDPYNHTRVGTVALQPDGKVLIGIWGIGNGNHIARLNSDGNFDNTFNQGTALNSLPCSVVAQADGKVLIGGFFTAVNGISRNGIARLNSDGSLDSSFNPGTGTDGYVLSVALQRDGKVLIGGSFTKVNGTNRNNLARLNANGSPDSTFSPGAGAQGIVRSIVLQADGNLLVGGDSTVVNGTAHARLVRLFGDSVAPSLSIVRSNAFVIVSWPLTGLNFQLQEDTNLSLPNSWSPVAQPAVTNAGQISVTVPTIVGRKFFRLKSQ